ncbi:kinase-like domain-containing protein [Dichotomocladium elegans]|nr:kinase-like domain-containing protein [Dichotomocladium elegans]
MGAVCCKGEELDFSKNEVELFHFYLLRVIGKGAFGKVHLVQHKGTLQEYALKCIRKDRCVELKSAQNMISERQLLERINYPLIVNLRYAFQDEDHLFMVLDLMLGGDLRFQLERNGPLSELQVRFYVAEIALSLAYLHRQKIAHRDIKPDNILLDANGHAHLSDFNIAAQFNEKHPLRWTRAGSLAYMAPEILAKRGYTTSVDWWSLGIVAYELLFGKRPFLGSTGEELTNNILNSPLTFPENVNHTVSDTCIDVLTKLLNRNPLERMGCGPDGFEEVKAHPWFNGIVWSTLEKKEATPPFTPSKKESNFDAVHELEELLLDGEPLRPRRRVMRPGLAENPYNEISEIDRARRLLDEHFLTFDITKQESWGGYDEAPNAQELQLHLQQPDVLRRIGGALNDHLDNAKYRGQGYVPAPGNEMVSFSD